MRYLTLPPFSPGMKAASLAYIRCCKVSTHTCFGGYQDCSARAVTLWEWIP